MGRIRIIVRTGLWSLWVTVEGFVQPDGDERAPVEPPPRGLSAKRRRLRTKYLIRHRSEAKVLADRLGITRVQLWGGGVPINVSDRMADVVRIEFGCGTVLDARVEGAAQNPSHLRLLAEPTSLPLLLT